MTAPVETRAAPAARSVTPPRRGILFSLIFGAVSVLVTFGAIALAAIAPTFPATELPAVPTSWRQVYNATPSAADGNWDLNAGCAFSTEGISLEGGTNRAECQFAPSVQHDYISSGFQLDLTLAPAGDTPLNEEAAVYIDDVVHAFVDQSGSYSFCAHACVSGNVERSGSSIAWHGGGSYANRITIRYEGPGAPVRLYLNDQLVSSVPVEALGPYTITLLTTQKSAAIYTHVTLTSAS